MGRLRNSLQDVLVSGNARKLSRAELRERAAEENMPLTMSERSEIEQLVAVKDWINSAEAAHEEEIAFLKRCLQPIEKQRQAQTLIGELPSTSRPKAKGRKPKL